MKIQNSDQCIQFKSIFRWRFLIKLILVTTWLNQANAKILFQSQDVLLEPKLSPNGEFFVYVTSSELSPKSNKLVLREINSLRSQDTKPQRKSRISPQGSVLFAGDRSGTSSPTIGFSISPDSAVIFFTIKNLEDLSPELWMQALNEKQPVRLLKSYTTDDIKYDLPPHITKILIEDCELPPDYPLSYSDSMYSCNIDLIDRNAPHDRKTLYKMWSPLYYKFFSDFKRFFFIEKDYMSYSGVTARWTNTYLTSSSSSAFDWGNPIYFPCGGADGCNYWTSNPEPRHADPYPERSFPFWEIPGEKAFLTVKRRRKPGPTSAPGSSNTLDLLIYERFKDSPAADDFRTVIFEANLYSDNNEILADVFPISEDKILLGFRTNTDSSSNTNLQGQLYKLSVSTDENTSQSLNITETRSQTPVVSSSSIELGGSVLDLTVGEDQNTVLWIHTYDSEVGTLERFDIDTGKVTELMQNVRSYIRKDNRIIAEVFTAKHGAGNLGCSSIYAFDLNHPETTTCRGGMQIAMQKQKIDQNSKRGQYPRMRLQSDQDFKYFTAWLESPPKKADPKNKLPRFILGNTGW